MHVYSARVIEEVAETGSLYGIPVGNIFSVITHYVEQFWVVEAQGHDAAVVDDPFFTNVQWVWSGVDGIMNPIGELTEVVQYRNRSWNCITQKFPSEAAEDYLAARETEFGLRYWHTQFGGASGGFLRCELLEDFEKFTEETK